MPHGERGGKRGPETATPTARGRRAGNRGPSGPLRARVPGPRLRQWGREERGLRQWGWDGAGPPRGRVARGRWAAAAVTPGRSSRLPPGLTPLSAVLCFVFLVCTPPDREETTGKGVA